MSKRHSIVTGERVRQRRLRIGRSARAAVLVVGTVVCAFAAPAARGETPAAFGAPSAAAALGTPFGRRCITAPTRGWLRCSSFKNSRYCTPPCTTRTVGTQLLFDFHKITMPMTHFHYDRFDTPDDEENGKWSVNFKTNPQGDIELAVMSLDEAEAVFTRKPETLDPQLLAKLAGSYETPTGTKIQVTYQESRGLSIVPPGAPPLQLNQVKGLRFRTPQFSDVVFEFVVENGQVTALKQRNPSGEFSFPKR
jgi:hypothetical protein